MGLFDFLTKRFRKDKEQPEIESPKLEDAPEESAPELDEFEEQTVELGEEVFDKPFVSDEFENLDHKDPDWDEPDELDTLVGVGGIVVNEQPGGGHQIVSHDEDVEAESAITESFAFGTCKIVSNLGDGEYTITRIKWDSDSGESGEYVADEDGEYFERAASDYKMRAYGVEGDTALKFWEQAKVGGDTEIVIDSMPMPDIPDPEKDYMFVFDSSESEPDKLKWVETTTDCPDP